MEGLDSKMEKTEERNHWQIEQNKFTQSEQHRENRWEKNLPVRDLWDYKKNT